MDKLIMNGISGKLSELLHLEKFEYLSNSEL